MAAPSPEGRLLHAQLDHPGTRRRAVAQIAAVYSRCDCAVELTCEHLGIQRSTLARWRHAYPTLDAALQNICAAGHR
jgi:hypothetical protein